MEQQYNTQSLLRDLAANLSCLLVLFFVYKVWGPRGLAIGCTLCIILNMLFSFFIILAYTATPSSSSNQE